MAAVVADETLRRRKPGDRVGADLLRQIEVGALKPGDRVLSVRELHRRYGVSYRAAVSALRAMVRTGVLAARPGSGYYVALSAPAGLPTSTAAHSAVPSSRPLPAMGALLRPRNLVRTLSVYVPEVYPDSIVFWQRATAAFARETGGVRIRLLSGRDGHIEDLSRGGLPDVVIHVPGMLAALGMDRFRPIESLRMVGLSPADLVAPVRRCRREGGELCLVPVSVTLPHVYVNLDLLAGGRRQGPVVRGFRSVGALLDATSGWARQDGGHGLVISTFRDLAMQAGALTPAAGRFRLDEDRLIALLNRARKASVVVDYWNSEMRFVPSQCAAVYQGCYLSTLLKREAKFRWAAMPVPCEPSGSIFGERLVAAIPRATNQPGAALDLVRHIAGEPFQKSLAALGHVLPVREAALEAGRWALSMGQIRKQLEQTTSERLPAMDEQIRNVLDFAFGALRSREIEAATIAARVRFLLGED